MALSGETIYLMKSFTGHFHIEKLQNENIKEDFSNGKMKTLLNIVKKGIEEGVKGI